MKKIIFFITLLFFPLLTFAHGFDDGGCMWFWPFRNFYFGGFIMGLILLVLIIVGLYFVFKKNGTVNIGSSSPLDILKARYAKGEISKEQFEEMKKDL